MSAIGTGGLAGTAGCINIQRARALFGRDPPNQVSLTIKTLPTDADPWSIRTARYLAERLETVGISARVIPTSRVALLRDVLVNQSFDLYIARSPPVREPDALRPLLHSRYTAEPGWQNPFGYANLHVDDLLEAQRSQSGVPRQRTVTEIQTAIARSQPFSVVAYPSDIYALRRGRVRGWTADRADQALRYLALRPPDPESPSLQPTPTTGSPNGTREAPPARHETLRMTTTDASVTRNLNPLAVEYRSNDAVIDLLYDSLGVPIDGRVRPWLAEDWTWVTTDEETPILDVSLRPNLTWHDGTALTPTDVSFTYRFLSDTSLGSFESSLPAPRYRKLSSMVVDTEVRDETTVRFQFVSSNRVVARRALTAPVLPAHVWRNKSSRATLAGFNPGRALTEAIIWKNPDPVGSGPLTFEQAVELKRVTLNRAGDHFLKRSDLPSYLRAFEGEFAFDRLEFVVVPSDESGVKLVQEGAADATAAGVTPSAIPQIGRSDAIDLHIEPAQSFYHVGFNVRRSPLRNPRFRRAVAQLLDKPFLVDQVFDDYATPAATPLAHLPSRAPGLRWKGADPELPFPGEDGRVAIPQAREAFREAGYRYTEDGNLVLS